jgi:hypothetical protein
MDTLASFGVSEESDIFIALDTQIRERPRWLQGYENTNTFLENDGTAGHVFQVYRRRFGTGETIWLGPNGGW